MRGGWVAFQLHRITGTEEQLLPIWKEMSVQGNPVCSVLDAESEPSLGVAQLETRQETEFKGAVGRLGVVLASPLPPSQGCPIYSFHSPRLTLGQSRLPL